VKAVNVSPNARPAEIRLSGLNPSGTGKVVTLESTDLNAENSLDHPKNIAPKSSTLALGSSTLSVQLNPYSVTIYRIPVR